MEVKPLLTVVSSPTVAFLLRDRRVVVNADGGPPARKSGLLANMHPYLPSAEWDMRSETYWHDHVSTALHFAIEDPKSKLESFTHACSVMTGADYLQLDQELYLPRVLDFFESTSGWWKKAIAFFFWSSSPWNTSDGDVPQVGSPHACNLLWTGMLERGAIATMLQLHAGCRVRVAFHGQLDLSDDTSVTQALLESATSKMCQDCPITTMKANYQTLWTWLGFSGPCLDVAFCADTLTHLEAKGKCGITQEGISKATRLTTLWAEDNKSIVSVDFCADTLTNLHMDGKCGITQEGISRATRLTTLWAEDNKSIVSVDFCADTLTTLDVQGCGITQEGISKATRLTTLWAGYNKSIVSVDFCADTLTTLGVQGECGITQEGISKATKLTTLAAWNNKSIVSVDFCADTLRHGIISP